MLNWGHLDAALPTPTKVIFEYGGWIPILIAVLIVGSLIYVFIRNNRDKKMIEDWEKEQDKENNE